MLINGNDSPIDGGRPLTAWKTDIMTATTSEPFSGQTGHPMPDIPDMHSSLADTLKANGLLTHPMATPVIITANTSRVNNNGSLTNGEDPPINGGPPLCCTDATIDTNTKSTSDLSSSLPTPTRQHPSAHMDSSLPLLVCRKTSHLLAERRVPVDMTAGAPALAVKGGRAVARSKLSDDNFVFDCKASHRRKPKPSLLKLVLTTNIKRYNNMSAKDGRDGGCPKITESETIVEKDGLIASLCKQVVTKSDELMKLRAENQKLTTDHQSLQQSYQLLQQRNRELEARGDRYWKERYDSAVGDVQTHETKLTSIGKELEDLKLKCEDRERVANECQTLGARVESRDSELYAFQAEDQKLAGDHQSIKQSFPMTGLLAESLASAYRFADYCGGQSPADETVLNELKSNTSNDSNSTDSSARNES